MALNRRKLPRPQTSSGHKNKIYLTPSGYNSLREELNTLLSVERPQVVKAVTDAAAMGDRSENAEYIYGKKRLREIDRRLRYLQKRLENVEIIDATQLSTDRVAFALWVTIEDEDGEIKRYQIVGEDEYSPKLGRITHTSPLGRSLLGKCVGEHAVVKRPSGTTEVLVLKIERPDK